MPRTPHPSTGTSTPEYQLFPEALKWNESYYAPTSQTAEGSRLTGSTDRRAPGETTGRTNRTQPGADLSRQKSKRNFFEDAFSADLTSLARERVHGDAMVMVEVKTNVIISDEFSFITELAYHISMRYQRPVSSVAVTLQHGACLFFGGSFEPAYAMSVVALPSQLLPTTNKRNAALMQRYMEETLGVIPERGCLRFVPAGEENLARGGKTVAGEVEEMEARLRREGVDCGVSGGEDDRGVRNRRMMSVRSLGALRRPPTPEWTPPDSADEGQWPVPTRAPSPRHKAAKRRKSFVASIFGRSGSKSSSEQSGMAAIAD